MQKITYVCNCCGRELTEPKNVIHMVNDDNDILDLCAICNQLLVTGIMAKCVNLNNATEDIRKLSLDYNEQKKAQTALQADVISNTQSDSYSANTDAKNLAYRIREYLRINKMTQADFCRTFNISPQTLYNVLCGSVLSVRQDTLDRFDKALQSKKER